MSPISKTPARDGILLANYCWDAAPGVTAPLEGPGTPSVYILHGLSEHAGRYDSLARWLARRGWRVGAHDHRGHGHSEGSPATLVQQDDLVRDAASRLQAWTTAQGRPPMLLGHSLGALVAALVTLHRLASVDGLILSSPPFQVHLPTWLFRGVNWMSHWAPDLRVPHGLAPAKISHDRAVVAAFRADPLVHRCMTPRLARFVLEGGRDAIQEAPSLSCPTLLLVAGDDAVVAAEGSREFARRAPADLLTLRWYDTAWHEIFNETTAISDPVYQDLDLWLSTTARALSLQPVLAPSAK